MFIVNKKSRVPFIYDIFFFFRGVKEDEEKKKKKKKRLTPDDTRVDTSHGL